LSWLDNTHSNKIFNKTLQSALSEFGHLVNKSIPVNFILQLDFVFYKRLGYFQGAQSVKCF